MTTTQEIRARHDTAGYFGSMRHYVRHMLETVATQAHGDRAYLLGEVERLRAGIAAHRDAVCTGLLGKAEQDAADVYLWSLLDEVTP